VRGLFHETERSVKIRQGRKNSHNLYLQVGSEPSESDHCLGLIIEPEVAKAMVELLNACGPDWNSGAGRHIFLALTGGSE
jgi:hypothetical protein